MVSVLALPTQEGPGDRSGGGGFLSSVLASFTSAQQAVSLPFASSASHQRSSRSCEQVCAANPNQAAPRTRRRSPSTSRPRQRSPLLESSRAGDVQVLQNSLLGSDVDSGACATSSDSECATHSMCEAATFPPLLELERRFAEQLEVHRGLNEALAQLSSIEVQVARQRATATAWGPLAGVDVAESVRPSPQQALRHVAAGGAYVTPATALQTTGVEPLRSATSRSVQIVRPASEPAPYFRRVSRPLIVHQVGGAAIGTPGAGGPSPQATRDSDEAAVGAALTASRVRTSLGAQGDARRYSGSVIDDVEDASPAAGSVWNSASVREDLAQPGSAGLRSTNSVVRVSFLTASQGASMAHGEDPEVASAFTDSVVRSSPLCGSIISTASDSLSWSGAADAPARGDARTVFAEFRKLCRRAADLMKVNVSLRAAKSGARVAPLMDAPTRGLASGEDRGREGASDAELEQLRGIVGKLERDLGALEAKRIAVEEKRQLAARAAKLAAARTRMRANRLALRDVIDEDDELLGPPSGSRPHKRRSSDSIVTEESVAASHIAFDAPSADGEISDAISVATVDDNMNSFISEDTGFSDRGALESEIGDGSELADAFDDLVLEVQDEDLDFIRRISGGRGGGSQPSEASSNDVASESNSSVADAAGFARHSGAITRRRIHTRTSNQAHRMPSSSAARAVAGGDDVGGARSKTAVKGGELLTSSVPSSVGSELDMQHSSDEYKSPSKHTVQRLERRPRGSRRHRGNSSDADEAAQRGVPLPTRDGLGGEGLVVDESVSDPSRTSRSHTSGSTRSSAVASAMRRRGLARGTSGASSVSTGNSVTRTRSSSSSSSSSSNSAQARARAPLAAAPGLLMSEVGTEAEHHSSDADVSSHMPCSTAHTSSESSGSFSGISTDPASARDAERQKQAERRLVAKRARALRSITVPMFSELYQVDDPCASTPSVSGDSYIGLGICAKSPHQAPEVDVPRAEEEHHSSSQSETAPTAAEELPALHRDKAEGQQTILSESCAASAGPHPSHEREEKPIHVEASEPVLEKPNDTLPPSDPIEFSGDDLLLVARWKELQLRTIATLNPHNGAASAPITDENPVEHVHDDAVAHAAASSASHWAVVETLLGRFAQRPPRIDFAEENRSTDFDGDTSELSTTSSSSFTRSQLSGDDADSDQH